jgi:hypothetical protein
MHKHLHEDETEEYRGRFVPTAANPRRYTRKLGLFRTREEFECRCGIKFLSEASYINHYRAEQLIESHANYMNAIGLIKTKALYWRRRAFVLEHGSEADVHEVKLIETPEMKQLEEIEVLVARVTDIWGPVYKEYAANNDVTVGQVLDETTIEDETPKEANRG